MASEPSDAEPRRGNNVDCSVISSSKPLEENADWHESAATDSEMAGSEVNEEEIEECSRSLILSLLGQLSKGMDLHRISFPCFVLEPRSLLERISDFMSHPQLLLKTPEAPNAEDRFVDVVRYFLSGWHIRPKGVKKPFNPVLGEFFRCRWECDDGSPSYYFAEQVSHHPPVSAYFYANPDNHIIAMGNSKPKGCFLGNSVMSSITGTSHLFFTNHPGEEYVMTNPNIYARGIFFGPLLMELGDEATIKCEKTDLEAKILFKVKGYFTGTYNAITGKIFRSSSGETLFEINGKWTDQIFINKPYMAPKLFFDATKCRTVQKLVAPIAAQDAYESRRLWHAVHEALINKDFDTAAIEKAKIEDSQRVLYKLRAEENIEWRPKFFRRSSSDELWTFVDRDVLKESPSTLHDHLKIFFERHYGVIPRRYSKIINT